MVTDPIWSRSISGTSWRLVAPGVELSAMPGIDIVRVPMSTAYCDIAGLTTCWPTACAERTATAAAAALREKVCHGAVLHH